MGRGGESLEEGCHFVRFGRGAVARSFFVLFSVDIVALATGGGLSGGCGFYLQEWFLHGGVSSCGRRVGYINGYFLLALQLRSFGCCFGRSGRWQFDRTR